MLYKLYVYTTESCNFTNNTSRSGLLLIKTISFDPDCSVAVKTRLKVQFRRSISYLKVKSAESVL